MTMTKDEIQALRDKLTSIEKIEREIFFYKKLRENIGISNFDAYEQKRFFEGADVKVNIGATSESFSFVMPEELYDLIYDFCVKKVDEGNKKLEDLK